ncbi:MAG: molybdopterin-guanine dinucleotide biosynthesis protein B [Dehalococcoidales bacterium]
MQPIISIVGKSESGKTTLLEGLIIELKQRGYQVATIKHSSKDFELDKVSKDSWRFSQAGSEVSAISSAHKLAVIKNLERDLSPQELSHFIWSDYDLILTEGFKQSSHPKIEIHRKEQGKELLSPPEQLLAVVTDEPLGVDVPQFSRDEVPKIADLIEKTLLAQRKENDVNLFINDTHIPINQATKNLLFRTLAALVAGLKGDKKIKSLRISLRRKT